MKLIVTAVYYGLTLVGNWASSTDRHERAVLPLQAAAGIAEALACQAESTHDPEQATIWREAAAAQRVFATTARSRAVYPAPMFGPVI